jgi:hypothetical protein
MRQTEVVDLLADIAKFRRDAIIAIAGIGRELRDKTLSAADHAALHHVANVIRDVHHAIAATKFPR